MMFFLMGVFLQLQKSPQTDHSKPKTLKSLCVYIYTKKHLVLPDSQPLLQSSSPGLQTGMQVSVPAICQHAQHLGRCFQAAFNEARKLRRTRTKQLADMLLSQQENISILL